MAVPRQLREDQVPRNAYSMEDELRLDRRNVSRPLSQEYKQTWMVCFNKVSRPLCISGRKKRLEIIQVSTQQYHLVMVQGELESRLLLLQTAL